MIAYYLNRRDNPISRKALKKKLGNEWGKVEKQAQELKIIYNHWALVDTKHGHVIVENQTLICLSQWVALLMTAVAFFLTLAQNSFTLSPVLKPVLFWTGIASMVVSAVIMFLGFKNDERHIVDMGTPLMWSGFITMCASFFW